MALSTRTRLQSSLGSLCPLFGFAENMEFMLVWGSRNPGVNGRSEARRDEGSVAPLGVRNAGEGCMLKA